MILLKRCFIYFFIIISFHNVAIAKWASIEEASIKRHINNYHINVNKDGTYEQLAETEFEILKEAGRDQATQFTLSYNGDSQKITVLEAKTIYQNKEYNVEKKFIEDKPLASSSNGFDQYRQILIAFPKVEIGSKIHLKYKFTTLKPPLNGYFSDFFDFGYKELMTNANIKITSKIPLHIMVNDPDNSLKITKDKEDNFYQLDASLIQPLYKETINEPRAGIENPKYFTWFSISSVDKWEDLSKMITKQDFSRIYTQELPKEFNDIAIEALKQKNEIDQINIVTSMLNDRIQYLSDRTTINGRLAPKTLEQTNSSQLGDCKDFSAATIAILTKIGYKAQFALIARGERNFSLEALPRIEAFDHVIVKVTNKDGKIYWIDPTNAQSMAGGIFPDIANKPTQVLDLTNPSYEKTPNIDPNHATSSHKKEIDFIDKNTIEVKGICTLKNEEASVLIAAELYTSKDSLENNVLNALSGTTLDETNKKKIILPDLTSRIVKDITIDYSYQLDNTLAKTNLGKAFQLEYDTDINDLIDIPNDMLSDLFLGAPYSFYKKTIINNIDAKNLEILNSEIDSKWLYISRNLSLTKGILTIEENTILKQSMIPNAELKTNEFLEFKDKLEQNFQNVSVVIN